jgi:pyruvate formate lyase activating enzyme
MNIPKIYGFNECSEAGPNIFCPVLFLHGCNMACPYCMNSLLAKENEPENIDLVSIDRIKKHVEENKSEMVMISGGEPTNSGEISLKNLIGEIASWGCKVGLSTNGTRPRILEKILPDLSYVALDFKGCAETYESIIKYGGKFENVILSKSLLSEYRNKKDDFDYEIRTTLYPPFISDDDLKEIGGIIRKDDTWVLQQFRVTKNMLNPNCDYIDPYDEKEIENLMNIAKEYSDKVLFRYV